MANYDPEDIQEYGDAPGSQNPPQAPQPAVPQTLGEMIGKSWKDFTTQGGGIAQAIGGAAMTGMQAARGDPYYAQRIQAQKFQQEQEKQLQGRRDLLTTLEKIQTGKSIGGKLGDLVVQQSLTELGFSEEIVKAASKEDAEMLEQLYAPLIMDMVQKNPRLTIDGARTLLSKMQPAQLVTAANQLRAQQQDAEVQKAMSELGPQQQSQQPQQPVQPMSNEQKLALVEQQRAYLNGLRGRIDPGVLKERLGELDKRQTDIEQAINRGRAEKSQEYKEERDIVRDEQRDKEMRRMASQFAQSLAQQGENQNRIDARQRNYLKAFMERPMDATTQKDIAALESIARQINNVETTYKKDYLGPVRGTESAFAARRTAGSLVGAGVGEDETIFRQSLADTADQLLRARSGAQINETEYRRLKNMLPKATDEEPTFKAGMKRFKTEIGAILQSKIKLGTTSRREVREEGTGGGASGGWSIKPK